MAWQVVWRVLVAAYAVYNVGGVPGAAEGWQDIVAPLGITAGRIVGIVLLVVIAVSLAPKSLLDRGRGRIGGWLPRQDDRATKRGAPYSSDSSSLGLTLWSIIREGDGIDRRRRIIGEARYVDAVTKWAGETDEQLERAGADALREEWREFGIQPPHDGDQAGEYLARSLQLFRIAYDDLGDEIPF